MNIAVTSSCGQKFGLFFKTLKSRVTSLQTLNRIMVSIYTKKVYQIFLSFLKEKFNTGIEKIPKHVFYKNKKAGHYDRLSFLLKGLFLY
jgi:hypothetical protein